MKEIQLKQHQKLLIFEKKRQSSRRPISAECWKKFRCIYLISEPHNIFVNNFVICQDCNEICHYNGSTTTKLKKHKCITSEPLNTSFNFASNSNKVTFSDSDKEFVKNTMSNFVAGNLHAIASVECKGYRDSIKAGVLLGQKYPRMTEVDVDRILFSRFTIKNFIEEKASIIINEIREYFNFVLNETGTFCVAADLWKDEHRANEYITLVAHTCVFVDKKIARKVFSFHTNSIEAICKTNQIVYQHIKGVFASFGIDEITMNRFIKWISDRGQNLVLALTHNAMLRISCFAHIINNIVKTMLDIDRVKSIVSNTKHLVKYMKTSGLNARLKKSLISFCETRWNAVYYTVKSLYENYDDVLKLLHEKEGATQKYDKVSKITCINKDSLKQLFEFLELFVHITVTIEGEKKPTLHYVWPFHVKIKKYLADRANGGSFTSIMSRAGIQYMDKNAEPFAMTDEHKIATFLHPYMKTLKFVTFGESVVVRGMVQGIIDNLREESGHNNQLIADVPDLNVQVSTTSSLFEDFIDATAAAAANLDEINNYMTFNVNTVSSTE